MHRLLADPGLGIEASDALRTQVLTSLIVKSESRSLVVDAGSLDRTGISDRLRNSYQSRLPELEPNAPPFEVAYERVRQYYINLPWSE